ncbi:MAG: amidohydrolase family protein [Candidatus Eisenbacteria bacterium]
MSGRAVTLAALVAVAALGTLASAPVAARAETIALVGGTVHPVSGPVIENGTVVMRDGRIESVGTGAVPAGARVVDVRGKHVYPGIISANTSLGLVEVESVRGTVDHTEAGNLNPNVRTEVEINPESEHLAVARVNGLTSALMVPRGGAIAGTSALMHLDGWTYEDMTVRAPVALHVNWPGMSIVRSPAETRSDEEQRRARTEATEAIQKAFDDARAYDAAVRAEQSAGIPRHDRDVKWDAMVRAVRGEIPVFFHASALNQIRAVLRFCDEQGLKNVALMGGYDAWRVAAELKTRGIAVICDPVLGMPRRRWESYDTPFSLPAKLSAAGVKFCIADGGGSMNARNLPYHASQAAAFGLSREEALKAVTLYPAQILGAGDRLGSLEPGKIADLVVTNSDLLEITTAVEQVYIAGKPVSMENRQTRLFQKYDGRPRGPKARKR